MILEKNSAQLFPGEKKKLVTTKHIHDGDVTRYVHQAKLAMKLIGEEQ